MIPPDRSPRARSLLRMVLATWRANLRPFARRRATLRKRVHATWTTN